MFLHAVDTSLQDKAIQKRSRPLLKTSDVQDEDLIQRMNEIVLEERSSTHQKNPKVNEMHASHTVRVHSTRNDKMNSPERESSKEDRVMATLQAVCSELDNLKESVEKNQASKERLTGTPLGSQNQQCADLANHCSMLILSKAFKNSLIIHKPINLSNGR